jgi:hypothetical protein
MASDVDEPYVLLGVRDQLSPVGRPVRAVRLCGEELAEPAAIRPNDEQTGPLLVAETISD